jgi:hypothetical protein
MVPLHTDPLMLPVQWQGQEYLTSQYFHRQYRENAGLQGKYQRHQDFRRLLRSIELYAMLRERGDIVELQWDEIKHLESDLKQPVRRSLTPLFQATGYYPLILINIRAQNELVHHLDDEFSKKMAYTANVVVERAAKPTHPAVPDVARQELDAHQFAADYIETEKRLDALFGIPVHLTLTEAAKALKASIGLDLEQKLLVSPLMDDIPYTDIFLEVRELQARFSLKNGTLNPILAKHGWQTRVGETWEATEKAQQQGHCKRHVWVNGTKSGINWKWRVAFVEGIVKAEEHAHG